MTYLKASRKRKRERARTQIQRQQKDNSYNKISPNKCESFKCAKLRSVSSESTRACARERESERARERESERECVCAVPGSTRTVFHSMV